MIIERKKLLANILNVLAFGQESFTTLQSGHLLYHSEANNGQAGVGFLINKKWKDNITREFQSSRTSPTHNRQIPTEDRSSICVNDISLR